MQRLFISGVGTVTPIGNDREAFWRNLTAGECGIGPLERIETGDLAVKIGGEVRNLDVQLAEVNDRVTARKMDRASLFAVVAAREALVDAGLGDQPELGENAAVVLGAGLSGLETLQHQTETLIERGPKRVSPFTIPLLMPNGAAANVSLAFGVNGPSYSVNSACASSGNAIIDAMLMLRRGEADMVITGGTEASLTRLGMASFIRMKAMAPDSNDRPTKSVRPFDANRCGFIMSEGAGVFVLETERSLRRRGVKAYAELLSYGSTTDAFHLVQPDPDAKQSTRAVEQAVQRAEWDPAEVAGRTYVSAHGTSTKFNDAAETRALKNVFGSHAKELQVSSTKSVIGHQIGAACAVETIACCLALTHQTLPPTINYETPDPECDLDYVPNVARAADVEYAVNNSFGFGGHNVSLTLRRAGEHQK